MMERLVLFSRWSYFVLGTSGDDLKHVGRIHLMRSV